MRSIQKSFGGVKALRDGNLEVREGEVHLLMGENGAGKSTLMKIVAGMQRADSGEMVWQGQPVSFARPADAAAHGIAMVHQESLLAPHLSVAENIFLGPGGNHRVGHSGLGLVNRRAIMREASALIEAHQFPLKAEMTVGHLSPAGKQLVEICRAIAQGSSLLIFDEPTSSLSEAETQQVFRIVRELCARKVAVIYITHRLEELRSIGDRVTVLRDGTSVHTGPLSELTREQLIQHMVGRPVEAVYHREPRSPGETMLKLSNVSRGFLKNISLEVRSGEIVGLAGLVGAGRTELCRVIFGVDPPDEGSIEVLGRPLKANRAREAVAAGVALIPEDRQRAGLALRLPISYNVTMPNLGAVSSLGVLRKTSETALAEDFRQRLRIKCNSVKQLAGRLSGGNQQKVVIAKWIARGAKVFLFDEPTRGIDIGAKQEVFQEMDRLAKEGAAVLMVSSELPELIQVADRIVVMRNGRITGELPGRTTQEAIMHFAAFAQESPTTLDSN
ncbi:MAG: sugar ABC transporter ATP-binding protein [Alphaproteobacteria bacterium]|nr:sugar ABC transporter ATP-binding protein [Alphaproteobacteria bacterium]